ncbi:unnamed protein product, partial [Mesorhabditis belari]|uniref:C-type lectin domain-containing protein n=1 Tax=Mesorhabditis belari TaxID=2138241 RepID=A0AAF3FDB7_9BILA
MRLLLLTIFLFALNSAQCPSRYFFEADLNTCLYYSGKQETFSAALGFCQANSGNLLSIHSPFQNNLLAQIQYSETVLRGWLGIVKTNGTWQWTDETPLDYLKFQSNDDDTLSCAILDSTNSMWKAVSCEATYQFLCSASPTSINQ